MNKVKIKQQLPLILLIGGLAYTLLFALTTDIGLMWRHYAGILLTSLTLAVYFVQQKFLKKALALTLVLGTFNALAFMPNITTVTVGISSVGITFQPFSLLILLLFMALNRKRIIEILGLESRKEDVAGEYYLDEEKVEKFKEKYSDRTLDELNSIVSNGTYVVEAIEAAKQLIEEKTNPNPAQASFSATPRS